MNKEHQDDISKLCSRLSLDRKEYKVFGQSVAAKSLESGVTGTEAASEKSAAKEENKREVKPEQSTSSRSVHAPHSVTLRPHFITSDSVSLDSKRRPVGHHTILDSASSHVTGRPQNLPSASSVSYRRALHRLRAEDYGRENRPSRVAQERSIVSIVPASGGVGATTATATLGQIFRREGENVLLVDGRPDTVLPIYFGGRMNSRGTRTYVSHRDDNGAAIQILGFEQEERTSGEQASELLHQCLSEQLREFDRVIVDTWPDLYAPDLAGSLNAGVVVVIAVPDLNCLIGVQRVAKVLRSARLQVQPILVLNKFDQTVSLHNDIYSSLVDQFPEDFSYFRVNRSDDACEALAEGLTVVDFAGKDATAQGWESVAAHILDLTTATTQTLAPSALLTGRQR